MNYNYIQLIDTFEPLISEKDSGSSVNDIVGYYISAIHSYDDLIKLFSEISVFDADHNRYETLVPVLAGPFPVIALTVTNADTLTLNLTNTGTLVISY